MSHKAHHMLHTTFSKSFYEDLGLTALVRLLHALHPYLVLEKEAAEAAKAATEARQLRIDGY